MLELEQCNPKIMHLLCEKTTVKQEVFRKMGEHFSELKKIVQIVAKCLDESMQPIDESVRVEFIDKNPYEMELRFGGDMLLFNRHTNVFTFDSHHSIWKTGYVKEDKKRAYFGMIHIYNFLTDSFQYNRLDDIGIMLGRIFINREGHFFVEGKRQLSFLYNNLVNDLLTPEKLKEIVDNAVIYALEYDLTAPDFKEVMLTNVRQMQNFSNQLNLKTSKKLGFKFHTIMEKGD